MKIVIAIDSFKGCLSSMEANKAAAEGVKDACKDADIRQVTVSDGGEGFLSAYHAAIGGEFVELTVMNPLMRPVRARYLLKDGLAVIEMAEASGLTLIAKEERNPILATTYGTGQLIADAVKKGVERIIVGLGGSATCDAGRGMLQALIDNFSKNRKWEDMDELKRIRFTIASDVRNPLCGEHGAHSRNGGAIGGSYKTICRGFCTSLRIRSFRGSWSRCSWWVGVCAYAVFECGLSIGY